jgi:hypothetical protein
LLFGVALCLLGPTTGLTQFQPGGGKGGKGAGGPGGGGPGGGMNFDPAQFAQMAFNRYSKDGKVINIADMPTQGKGGQNPQAAMQAWAESHGVTNGQITLEQYTQYLQDQRGQFQGKGGGGGGGPGSPRGQGQGGPGGQGNFQPPQPPRDFDKDAEDSFRRHDHEGNGRLTIDDVPRWLQDEWEMWDKGGKGFLDLSDYKEAYKAHQNTMRDITGGSGGNQDPRNPRNRDNQDGDTGQDGDKRSTVYHVGNLPKDLPPWFVQLDSDRDGQIGLYEWKRGNMDLNLFMEIDANSDGFLTVEEVLRWQKMQIAKKKAQANNPAGAEDDDPDAPPSDKPATTPSPGFNRGNFGGPGGNRGNFGGPSGPGGNGTNNPWQQQRPGANGDNTNPGGNRRFGPGGNGDNTNPGGGQGQRPGRGGPRGGG